MLNYRSPLAAILCFAASACGDHGPNAVLEGEDAAVSVPAEATDTTSAPSPSSTNDTSTTKREGPWGCYLEDHHQCDCSIESEEGCDGVGVWVEGCSTCAPAAEDTGATFIDGGHVFDTNVPDASPHAGFGCYDPAAHECTCGGTESECAENGTWTQECGCAEASDAASAASTDAGEVDASTPDSGATASTTTAEPASSTVADAGTGWGCYAPDSHQCDCETDEAGCSARDGIWTTECACSALDAGQ